MSTKDRGVSRKETTKEGNLKRKNQEKKKSIMENMTETDRSIGLLGRQTKQWMEVTDTEILENEAQDELKTRMRSEKIICHKCYGKYHYKNECFSSWEYYDTVIDNFERITEEEKERVPSKPYEICKGVRKNEQGEDQNTGNGSDPQ